jgi:hypothetical protein
MDGGLAALTEHLSSPVEWVWGDIADSLSVSPLPYAGVLDWVIVSAFPGILDEFRACGGAAARPLCLCRTGISGAFTLMEWVSRGTCHKADESMKGFLFTAKNPQNMPAKRSALKSEEKNEASYWCPACGPHC